MDDEDDMGDDYVDDFEQFGEEAKSPQAERKMVKVVATVKSGQQQQQMTQSGKPVSSEWDFDEDGYSENLFSSKASKDHENMSPESQPQQHIRQE